MKNTFPITLNHPAYSGASSRIQMKLNAPALKSISRLSVWLEQQIANGIQIHLEVVLSIMGNFSLDPLANTSLALDTVNCHGREICAIKYGSDSIYKEHIHK